MLSIKYSVPPIFRALLFMLVVFAGLPGTLISADGGFITVTVIKP